MSMGIAHDLGLLNLFVVSVTSVRIMELWLTRPIAAKWFSSSLLSTRWLRPETWRLLPGFWPPGEAPRLNLWDKYANRGDRHRTYPLRSLSPLVGLLLRLERRGASPRPSPFQAGSSALPPLVTAASEGMPIPPSPLVGAMSDCQADVRGWLGRVY